MDNNNLSQWVADRTALLDPPADWQPNTRIALAHLRARMDAPPAPRTARLWARWALAGALASTAIFLLPPARSLTQQLWQFLTVRRLDFPRLNLDNIPKDSSLIAKMWQSPGNSVRVRDVEEAHLHAGFAPRLPSPGILAGTPQLSTTGPMTFGTVLKAADLEYLLRKEGITDVPVPANWDGARIGLAIQPLVTAEWQDISLIQSLPPTIVAPAGFDFPAFMAALLRGLGVPRDQALRLARQSQALMLPIELDENIAIKEVQLRSPGTMVYDLDDSGKIERITLTWSVTDRIYILSGV